MLIDAVQAELVRLQLHPVNLSVSQGDGALVYLRGSLLKYWKLPPCLDGPWLLVQLQTIRDVAGPEAVMTALVAACGSEASPALALESKSQLRLFDPQSKIAMK